MLAVLQARHIPITPEHPVSHLRRVFSLEAWGDEEARGLDPEHVDVTRIGHRRRRRRYPCPARKPEVGLKRNFNVADWDKGPAISWSLVHDL